MRMPIVSVGKSLEHRWLSLSLDGWGKHSDQTYEGEGSEKYCFAEDG
jgi:hypothetical protein